MNANELEQKIADRYRIINNGRSDQYLRYKVQRKWLLGIWRDCVAVGLTDEFYYPSIGVYKTESEAIAAMEDLITREFLKKHFCGHG